MTGQELNRVLARSEQDRTVNVTAIHKHLQDETPRLWWIHYAGYGDRSPSPAPCMPRSPSPACP
ncbi:DUF1259 domain-containing protein [Pseudonocardia sp. K10HN5]|uniref:DUF1259 domain-containing protein n=1 Tax=Pseudonocardia acidicola TaxID=2724939 RepID=A0ABX1S646_9PSEU|nr:DUF1259 domain-containing protein [Pseudonocardia acidicola]